MGTMNPLTFTVFRSNWKGFTVRLMQGRNPFHCFCYWCMNMNSVEKAACRMRERERGAAWFSSSGIGNVSLWRGKKKIMGREGLVVVHLLKRAKQHNEDNEERLREVIKRHVSRLLKSDLLSVLAEFQRQDDMFLALTIYNVVRKEIWYRPDKFFYRDMLISLARNKKREEAMKVWKDMKGEEIHLDQHTYADIVRAFLDNVLPTEAMTIYEDMRQSLDLPLELPYRVILKSLLPYPQLRKKVKQDFEELFHDIQINDPPE